MYYVKKSNCIILSYMSGVLIGSNKDKDIPISPISTGRLLTSIIYEIFTNFIYIQIILWRTCN